MLATKRDLVAKKNYQYYLITNTRGDVIETRNGDGNVNAKFVYDAWGKLVSVTDANGNALASDSFAYQISLKYRGYVYDTETGLYYLQSRYYDPETGRFLNADSVAFLGLFNTPLSYNSFIYCENNSVNRVDYFGFLWRGRIHNEVINHILKHNFGLTNQIKIRYYSGGYGYCDLIDFHTKEIWEVKRSTVSYESAKRQLKKYLNGYYEPDRGSISKDFVKGTNRLGERSFYYENYRVYYWYKGEGIIYYNYEKRPTMSASPEFAVLPEWQLAPIFSYVLLSFAITLLAGLMGGMASPKTA